MKVKLQTRQKFIPNGILTAVIAGIGLLCAGPVCAAAEAPTGNSSQSTPEADNTGVNVRDRSTSEVTADQQTTGKADTEITRQIRRALTKDGSLSVYAHNIKIVTLSGVVTLKGPVKTDAEKMKAEQTAKSVAGVQQVIDELSVKR